MIRYQEDRYLIFFALSLSLGRNPSRKYSSIGVIQFASSIRNRLTSVGHVLVLRFSNVVMGTDSPGLGSIAEAILAKASAPWFSSLGTFVSLKHENPSVRSCTRVTYRDITESLA